MNKEKNIFALLIGLFLAFYFMPMSSDLFTGAILSGFKMLHEYSREHVLTCLVPAFFIAGAIAVFVKKDFVLKYLGSKAKRVVSYSIASISGGVLAVCSCTVLPMFAGIRKRGAGLGPAITFLFSGPAINIAAIFLTISVLGPGIGLFRILLAIPLAILVGLSMQAIFREKTQEGELFMEQDSSKSSTGKYPAAFLMIFMVGILVVNGLQMALPLKYGLMIAMAGLVAVIALTKFQKETNKQWMSETWSFTKMLLPLLFIGVFIAGFIEPLLPRQVITDVVGANTIVGNLVASVFGAFMYFSTLTEIPILQALINKGMHSGPAVALLLAGPSLSLPNMLVVRGVLGNKKTAVYVLLVVIYSTLGGLLAGFFI
ncbi:MAG: permease [Candidatus Moranbacteria bacterium]|nr:permease [Candidatus Moranbacteria bacterium]